MSWKCRALTAVFTTAVLAVGAAGCATKKFVTTEVDSKVAPVNAKVETLSKAVEENQDRTRKNEGRIGEVDKKADAAGRAAGDARTAANDARTAANAAGSKAADVEKAAKRLIYEVVLNEAKGNFKFGGTDIPDEVKAELDQLVAKLKAEPSGAYIEIEGHTDSVGSNEINHTIGLERAEAVRRYLYEQHQVPLHKMNVISYGEGKPVAKNNTRAGRAQNRRVVIRVLS